MNNLYKYSRYNLTQRYCLYKALGLDVACEALIDLMNESQLKLISQVEFLSSGSASSFVNKLWSGNV